MVEGNIYFHAAKEKNITFKVSEGASIMFGNTNILQLPNQTQTDAIQRTLSVSQVQFDALRRTSVFQQKSLIDFLRKIMDMKMQHANLTEQVHQMNNSRSQNRTTRKLKVLILRLSSQIEKLLKLMKKDECVEEAPCKNGATCIDLFGKYQCICPNHYEGENCDKRIDECELYKGTHAGCQNNATCTNNVNVTGFTCQCPTGFHGHLCQQQKSSCEYELDLCGEHGHCIPSEQPSGYKCICEWGFKQSGDPNNPTCIDINECTNNPCYPGSACINLPGSFKCSGCPKGTIGNGIHCHDFDECANDYTNDCSKSPKVDCINIQGSYKCGPCPTGDENVCHWSAQCVEDEGEVRCECPSGTVGDGIGVEGCQTSNTSACRANTCLNDGTCLATSENTYKCVCKNGYFGAHCETPTPCLSQEYCNLHGKCVPIAEGKSAHCECYRGYYGSRCQWEEEACGFHSNNETGEIVYEKLTFGAVLRSKICTWFITLFDTRKVLQINFENITIPKLYEVTSKGCDAAFVNLTIFDGRDTDAPLIVNFCHGDNSLSMSHPIYTSSHQFAIQLSTRLLSRNTYLKMNWKAVETRCGGRMTGKEGRVDYYDAHDEDNCMWWVALKLFVLRERNAKY
ncbi:EGF-like domain-containing protein [Ditylenchus destructor]|nr:EGF-like domain-containing protein [Ditylenchus destructor]